MRCEYTSSLCTLYNTGHNRKDRFCAFRFSLSTLLTSDVTNFEAQAKIINAQSELKKIEEL